EQAARLRAPFAGMTPAELLDYFRNRSQPHFLPGFSGPRNPSKDLQRGLYPRESDELLARAEAIITKHTWPMLGLGDKSFGDPIDWLRDPVSGANWPLDYHAEVNLNRGDGSDARVLWELNRLPHFITLAQAYTVTADERFTADFLQQLAGWRLQNPYGYGPNWNCAMEAALRAINLLGAFEAFRHSRLFDEEALATVLAALDEHGTFIRGNLEFSYIATSNHYLSDVVGLVWLGIMLPELEQAAGWREFGLQETLREMDKQVLADGADFESSTGYHRFVLELFLYTFILCRANEIEIEKRYWDKLRDTLNYVRGYLRPDGRAPLIGDSDGGQVFPIRARDANDHAYVLAVGGVLFKDARLLPDDSPMPEEVLWVLGEEGADEYQKLKSTNTRESSAAFPDAGLYVLRAEDLYLNFNVTDAGIGGRGSHGHNDALSIEVSAGGVAFIVDPGTYVYTADLKERHRFRSTAYHSTVEIDGVEQNTTDQQFPFVIGNEAKPQVLSWETGAEFDRVSGEHFGYRRLPQPVTHRRTVTFNKLQRWWLIEDEFQGNGEYDFAVTFHMNSGIDVSLASETSVWACDRLTDARLFIGPLDLKQKPEFENQFTSTNYHEKTASISACWQFRAKAPCTFRWILIPTRGEDYPQIPQI
ncbi:MAG TPA: alginate lyase family protein, partial [Pyrinomonadaceae bacterium]|nr:alginate lyase family protein [Pyrinomonadaceae bacterium]